MTTEHSNIRERVDTWECARYHMSTCHRSEAGKRAGLWALEVLEKTLGNDWIKRAIELDREVPSFVLLASFNTVAFEELLQLAVLLTICSNVPGTASIRKAMRGDARFDQLSHAKLQLETTHLAQLAGCTVQCERRPKGKYPIDIWITADQINFGVESFVLFQDDEAVAADEFAGKIARTVHMAMFQHNVMVTGSVATEDLNENLLSELVGAVEAASWTAYEKQEIRKVESNLADLLVTPNSISSGTGTFEVSSSTGRGWDRIADKLRTKAEQASRAGASWLRVDLFDRTWQLTPWATMRLTEKSTVLAEVVRDAITEFRQLHGVVASSGSTTALYSFDNECVENSDGVIGLRHKTGMLRAREVIMIPSGVQVEDEANLWFQIYDNEQDWLERGLRDCGLGTSREIFSTSRI